MELGPKTKVTSVSVRELNASPLIRNECFGSGFIESSILAEYQCGTRSRFGFYLLFFVATIHRIRFQKPLLVASLFGTLIKMRKCTNIFTIYEEVVSHI
jgi:hypothetical protein